ncbi:hypothetical protein WJX82_004510 [Trebouxia sp. C0006]
MKGRTGRKQQSTLNVDKTTAFASLEEEDGLKTTCVLRVGEDSNLERIILGSVSDIPRDNLTPFHAKQYAAAHCTPLCTFHYVCAWHTVLQWLKTGPGIARFTISLVQPSMWVSLAPR